MKILNLTLNNFQGMKDAHFEFGDGVTDVFGDNATGKTTLYNAITWLLFDCASTGAKGFTPKTKTADGDAHNLEHSAEATFELEDGRIITMKKVFHEVWKRKRGAASEEFSGHTVDYYIDGVPVKESEYLNHLSAAGGGIEQMKLLTMPDGFAERLPWEQRRRILLEICGDVSDDDIIAAQPELTDLPAVLEIPGSSSRRYTVEEYRKIAAAKKSEINAKLKAIPERIDEAGRALSQLDTVLGGKDIPSIDAMIESGNRELNSLMDERSAAADADTEKAEAKRRLVEAQLAFATAKSEHEKKQNEELEAIRERSRELTDNLAIARRHESEVSAKIAEMKKNVAEMKAKREALVADYSAIQHEQWDDGRGICPTCHRPLPEDEIVKLKQEFNLRRSERLTALNERGKSECSQQMIADAEGSITTLEAELARAKTTVLECENRVYGAEKVQYGVPGFASTPRGEELQADIDRLTAELEAISSGENPRIVELDTKIKQCRDTIADMMQEKARVMQRASTEERIAELEAEEKQLAATYEELERGIYLCDQFIRAKVGKLTDRINGRFKSVRFRLFNEQINGGLKEDCEVMIPDSTGRMVPYAFANNAARINAGMEIIRVLGDHYGVRMPVVVDNAESVTALNCEGLQVVKLIVSAADKTLRVAIN